MTDSLASVAQRLAALERRVGAASRPSKLAYSSIEAGAIQVYDEAGSLQAVVGQQADGTAGVVAVNGTPPPTPTAPVVEAVLGGLRITWDGQWADAQVAPLDFSRVQVHLLATADAEPDVLLPSASIEAPSGASVLLSTGGYDQVWVRLVAVNTSGTPGLASTAAPGTPRKAVQNDLLAGAVGELQLAADAVTAAKVALGAVTPDKLAVGVGNLIPDASFEGQVSAALVADLPDLYAIDSPGNQSDKALRINCLSEAAASRNRTLTTLPVSPGDEFFLAVDYKTSADWLGQGARIYCQWSDAAGASLGWGVVDDVPVPGGDWKHLVGQVTAPAGAVSAGVVVEAYQAMQGLMWFDNAQARPLVVLGMLAADSVTSREIVAGSVTADELDVNSARLAILIAGAINAEMLDADAITGKTITGGRITGATLAGNVTLVYRGTPRRGNLMLSMAPTAGTDQFGNAYDQGFSVYGDDLDNQITTALNGGEISMKFVGTGNGMSLTDTSLGLVGNRGSMSLTSSGLQFQASNDGDVVKDPGGLKWDWIDAGQVQRYLRITSGDDLQHDAASVWLFGAEPGGAVPLVRIDNGGSGRVDLQVSGQLRIGGGRSLGTGVVGYASLAASVTGITTTETEVLNSAAVTWKAGRAYRVSIACYGASTVAGDIVRLRLRKTHTTGTAYHDWFDSIVCTRVSQNNPWQGEKVMRRTATTDLSAALSFTAVRNAGTGSISLLTNTANQSYLLVEDIGEADDFPGAYAIA